MRAMKASGFRGFNGHADLQMTNPLQPEVSNGKSARVDDCAPRVHHREYKLVEPAVPQREIRVGIVGANAQASWAKVSHVPAINMGEVYAHLVRDLRAGTFSTPGIEHALHHACLIEAERRAAERGIRQKLKSEDLEATMAD